MLFVSLCNDLKVVCLYKYIPRNANARALFLFSPSHHLICTLLSQTFAYINTSLSVSLIPLTKPLSTSRDKASISLFSSSFPLFSVYSAYNTFYLHLLLVIALLSQRSLAYQSF